MSPKKITSMVDADSLHHPLQNEEKCWEKRKKIAEGKGSDLIKSSAPCVLTYFALKLWCTTEVQNGAFMIVYIQGSSFQFGGRRRWQGSGQLVFSVCAVALWNFLGDYKVIEYMYYFVLAAFPILDLRCKQLEHCITTKYY